MVLDVKPIQILNLLDISDWPTLYFGLERGWILKSDIEEYAVNSLASCSPHKEGFLIELSEASTVNNDDIYKAVLALGKNGEIDKDSSLEKWILALLSELNASNESEDGKIERLQELYAELDYPEIMSSCSIYAADQVDPLLAMSAVISSLRDQYC